MPQGGGGDRDASGDGRIASSAARANAEVMAIVDGSATGGTAAGMPEPGYGEVLRTPRDDVAGQIAAALPGLAAVVLAGGGTWRPRTACGCSAGTG